MNGPAPTLSEKTVRSVFDHLVEPKLKWTINALSLLKAVQVEGANVTVEVHLVTEDAEQIKVFREQVTQALAAIGATRCTITISRVNVATEGVTGIRHIVLVGAGKGGVGKSSIAVNLACGFKRLGFKVGLMDADIYGPSIPVMLGTTARPEVLPDEYLMPVEAYGLKTMSIGYLVKDLDAMDWRGQVASGTILQFIRKTFWGELDFLVIDLPPGTGDIQITLAHKVKSDGVVVVTTPQEIALGDVRRAVMQFRASKIPILGLVENMSYVYCEHCGMPTIVFPKSSHRVKGDPLLDLDLLTSLPLDPAIARSADAGLPIALAEVGKEKRVADIFIGCARFLATKLGEKPRDWDHAVRVVAAYSAPLL